MTGQNYPSPIAQAAQAVAHGMPPEHEVGEILRRLDAGRQLSGAELDRHIADCCVLWQRAYARFEAHGNYADRDEAVLWLHRQSEAILLRPGMDRFLPWRARETR